MEGEVRVEGFGGWHVLRAVAAGGLVLWAACVPAVEADCRDCHAAAPRPSGAADYSAFYRDAVRHHPVDRPLPGGDDPAWRQADGVADGVPFYDTNRNGIAEIGEVRLSPRGTVECLSCHREHGDGDPVAPPVAAWLRMDNADSRLCGVCHRI